MRIEKPIKEVFIKEQENPQRHVPVLLKQVLESFAPQKESFIIDATFGAGGYTRAFLDKGAFVCAFDRDPKAIAEGNALLKLYPNRLKLIQARFSEIENFKEEFFRPIDGIILDIGVSSMQIDEAERGFSFQKNGPLDMRMEQKGVSAADVINYASEQNLARMFYILGEERYARRIAKMIVKTRAERFFTTTLELANAIESLLPRKAHERIHPATRVFQALRIYVNDELAELRKVLLVAERLLPEGKKLGVVTFHSLEDRIVKQFFKTRSSAPPISRHVPIPETLEPSFQLLFKKARIADEQEVKHNPRARSAKLRVGVRTKAAAFPTVKEDFISQLPSCEGVL